MSFAKLEDIFHRALELPTLEERERFVWVACNDDVDLRDKVLRLLAAEADRPKSLSTQADSATRLEASAEGPGTRIGRYKLLQQIGEGGMGVVYMAEQEEPVRRRVALKIIKLGMDTKQVVARFEAERQALALMDHPHIAKVLDGGATDTGRPFFVMELVQGIPITEYCDKAKLPARDRLKLFIQVCQAIQSAHQKGIIHRDIKPSNVLITMHNGEAMPKVIDFGIAKATNQRLTEKTLFTNFATMIGTPAYMSPEQAEFSSMDVDTRADIYSLGVLLYALLTGTTPFPEKRLRSVAYGEMQRIIREEEPERPSTRLSTMANEDRTVFARNYGEEIATLSKLLKGDLDWIVMKCLEKDRNRRYETTSGLATDIQRHLINEPVTARPPTAAYRLQKTLRRHRSAVAAAGAVALALVLGLVLSTWEAVRASRAERRQLELRAAAEVSAVSASKAQRVAERAKEQAESATVQARHLAEQRRQETYAAEMRAAQVALDFGNLGQCRKLLLKYKPAPGGDPGLDLRGVEWRYLWLRSGSDSLADLPLESEAAGAAISPDGRWIAAVERNGVLTAWEAPSLKKAYAQRTHASEPPDWQGSSPAFSADSTMLAFCASNGVQVVSTKHWEPLHTLTGGYFSVAFALRTNILAAVGEKARVWRFDSFGKVAESYELPTQTDSGLRFTAPVIACTQDGSEVLIGDLFRGIMVFDVRSNRLVRTLPDFPFVKSLAISPDGNLFAAGTFPGYIGLWTLRGFQQIVRQRVSPSFVFGLGFSSDGQILATGGSDQEIKLWKVPAAVDYSRVGSLANIARFRGHENSIHSLCSGGDRWLSSGKDLSVRLWPHSASAERFHEFRSGRSIWAPGYDPLGRSRDGKRQWWFLSGGDLAAWDVRAGGEAVAKASLPADAPRLESKADLGRLSISAVWHEGELFYVTTDGFAARFDPETGSHRKLFALAETNSSLCAIVSNQGTPYLITAVDTETNSTWGTWELHSGAAAAGPWAEFRAEASPREDDSARTICQSPDGKWIAQQEANHMIALWDTTKQQRGARIQGSDHVYDMSIPPRNHVLIASFKDGTAGVWDIESGARIGVAMGGQLSGVFAARLSADGRTLVTCGDDLTTRMYCVQSGQEMILIPDTPPYLRDVQEPIDDGILFALDSSATSRPAYLRLPSLAEIDAEIARAARFK